jgi:hypothetical protein
MPFPIIGSEPINPFGPGRLGMISSPEGRFYNHVSVAAILIMFAFLSGTASSVTAFGQEMAVTKIKVISIPSQSKEIRPLHFFPTENDVSKDVLLTLAQFMSADSNGRIYVSDVKANEVLVFNKDGSFIRKIGRTGQGPGEFNLVGRALMTSCGLAVLDRSNARIQYFDDRGRFVDSIKLTKSYGDMAIGSDGTVFAFSNRYDTDEMISAIDAEGKVESSFGLPPQDLNKGPKLCWPALGPRDELYVAFWFYPLIQVYSPKGDLRSCFEIDYRPMQEKLSKNKAQSKVAPGGARVIGESIIEAIFVDDSRFYLLYRGKRIEILEFKLDGTFVKTFWTAQAPDYYPRGLMVLPDEGRKTFYLLQEIPENRIDVFVEK